MWFLSIGLAVEGFGEVVVELIEALASRLDKSFEDFITE